MTHSVKTRLFSNGNSSYTSHTPIDTSLWPVNRVLEKIALIHFNICKGNIPEDIVAIMIYQTTLWALEIYIRLSLACGFTRVYGGYGGKKYPMSFFNN